MYHKTVFANKLQIVYDGNLRVFLKADVEQIDFFDPKLIGTSDTVTLYFEIMTKSKTVNGRDARVTKVGKGQPNRNTTFYPASSVIDDRMPVHIDISEGEATFELLYDSEKVNGFTVCRSWNSAKKKLKIYEISGMAACPWIISEDKPE